MSHGARPWTTLLLCPSAENLPPAGPLIQVASALVAAALGCSTGFQPFLLPLRLCLHPNLASLPEPREVPLCCLHISSSFRTSVPSAWTVAPGPCLPLVSDPRVTGPVQARPFVENQFVCRFSNQRSHLEGLFTTALLGFPSGPEGDAGSAPLIGVRLPW